jgi:hypothetical protein
LETGARVKRSGDEVYKNFFYPLDTERGHRVSFTSPLQSGNQTDGTTRLLAIGDNVVFLSLILGRDATEP